ncbi:MAG: NnrS family protein [Phycisphaerae bacterium]
MRGVTEEGGGGGGSLGCVAVECVPQQTERLYRWFFTSAIAVTLTAGATWGGWILFQIGARQAFTGVSIHAINAHGHAQIYGWMGLFIMGFGYHVLPRFWRGVLAAPRLAPVVLGLVMSGILVRTVGMTTVGEWRAAVPVAMAGCGVEVAAIAIFALQMAVTCRRGKTAFRPESGYLMGAMVWMVVMSLFDAFHTYMTMASATEGELLWYVGTYQAPLRDLQIHGVALFMILGISSRMIPAFYGRPAGSGVRGWCAVGLLGAGVAGEVVIFLVYRWSGVQWVAALLMAPWVMLATGVVLQVWPWRLWEAPRRVDRSDKFIRMAFGWLALSLAMLLMLPVYQAAVGIPFSHAYYGAIRHAITVGFVSLMIAGMSARFVPAIRGIASSRLPRLRGPFVLVNVGCLLRASMQTLTDWYTPVYGVIGVSALLEIAGLTWWAVDLLRTMWGSPSGRVVREASSR